MKPSFDQWPSSHGGQKKDERGQARHQEFAPEDIEDELQETEPELLRLFRSLPKELWPRHFGALKALTDDSEDEAIQRETRKSYMAVIVEAREKAIVESVASDEALRQKWAENPGMEEALGKTLQETLTAEGNILGWGMTARVKRTAVGGIEKPIAVKYLLTPTAQTLSASAEHEMLGEVETITQIENAEHRLGAGRFLRVPHPYFFYRRGKLQCYGMSEVDGVNLETLLRSPDSRIDLQEDIRTALRERFASEEAREALEKEIDLFVTAMHEVCLHGDIKDRNLMVDRDGMFYLIDFGQSVKMHTASEKTGPQFEKLKDDERWVMHNRIRNILSQVLAAKE